MDNALYDQTEDATFEMTLDKLTRESHLEYIVNALLNNSMEHIQYSIELYELKYNASFDLDSKRYMYKYLAHVNINQALNLYDSLKEEEREVVIDVIKIDHLHLSQLVDIHEEIMLMNADIFTPVIQ